MTGEELYEARATLGRMWGRPGPITLAELGHILELQGRDPGATVRDWERRNGPTGPASVAIKMMLAGALPEGVRR